MHLSADEYIPWYCARVTCTHVTWYILEHTQHIYSREGEGEGEEEGEGEGEAMSQNKR